MKYRKFFLLGVAAGIALVLMAKAWQQPEPPVARVAAEHGERRKTVELAEKMILMQTGQAVEELEEGTRLWQTSERASQPYLELQLTWNNDGSFETVFLDVAASGTPAERNAFAILAPRK